MDNRIAGAQPPGQGQVGNEVGEELTRFTQAANQGEGKKSKILILDGDNLSVVKRKSGVITSIKRLAVRFGGLFGKDKDALNKRFGLDQDNKAKAAANRFTELLKDLGKELAKNPAYITSHSAQKILKEYQAQEEEHQLPENLDPYPQDDGDGVGGLEPDQLGDRNDEAELEEFPRRGGFEEPQNVVENVAAGQQVDLPDGLEKEIDRLVDNYLENFNDEDGLVDKVKMKGAQVTQTKILMNELQEGFVAKIRKFSLEEVADVDELNLEEEGKEMGKVLNSMNDYIKGFCGDKQDAMLICQKILVGSLGDGLDYGGKIQLKNNYEIMLDRSIETNPQLNSIRDGFLKIANFGTSNRVVRGALEELIREVVVDEPDLVNNDNGNEQFPNLHRHGQDIEVVPKQATFDNPGASNNDLQAEVEQLATLCAQGWTPEEGAQVRAATIKRTEDMSRDFKDEFVARIHKFSVGEVQGSGKDLQAEGLAMGKAMSRIESYISDVAPGPSRDQARIVCKMVLKASLEDLKLGEEGIFAVYSGYNLISNRNPIVGENKLNHVREGFVSAYDFGSSHGVVTETLQELTNLGKEEYLVPEAGRGENHLGPNTPLPNKNGPQLEQAEQLLEGINAGDRQAVDPIYANVDSKDMHRPASGDHRPVDSRKMDRAAPQNPEVERAPTFGSQGINVLSKEIKVEVDKLVKLAFDGKDLDKVTITRAQIDRQTNELAHALQNGFVAKIHKFTLDGFGNKIESHNKDGENMAAAANLINSYVATFPDGKAKEQAMLICDMIMDVSLDGRLGNDDRIKIFQSYKMITDPLIQGRLAQENPWVLVGAGFHRVFGYTDSHVVIKRALELYAVAGDVHPQVTAREEARFEGRGNVNVLPEPVASREEILAHNSEIVKGLLSDVGELNRLLATTDANIFADRKELLRDFLQGLPYDGAVKIDRDYLADEIRMVRGFICGNNVADAKELAHSAKTTFPERANNYKGDQRQRQRHLTTLADKINLIDQIVEGVPLNEQSGARFFCSCVVRGRMREWDQNTITNFGDAVGKIIEKDGDKVGCTTVKTALERI